MIATLLSVTDAKRNGPFFTLSRREIIRDCFDRAEEKVLYSLYCFVSLMCALAEIYVLLSQSGLSGHSSWHNDTQYSSKDLTYLLVNYIIRLAEFPF